MASMARSRSRTRVWLRPWNRSRLLARLAERMFGIAADMPIPQLSKQPFTPPAPIQDAPRCEVLLFADTFATHFEPDIAQAAIEVLTAAGYSVKTVKPAPDDPEPDRPLCCGRTYLTHGMVEEARREGRRVLAALRPAIKAKTPVIGLEPSCLLSLRDELYCLGLGAEAGQLGKQLFLLEEFLVREQARGLRLPLKDLPDAKALVHGHCHQKAFGTIKSMRKIVGSIPGLSYELINSSCCGMAGSFGLEAEHREASQAMAELSILPALRAAPEETRVIANGFSCRHQIAQGSNRKARHIALVPREALDTSASVSVAPDHEPASAPQLS